MKINAIGISSKSLTKSIKFYEIVGFEFPKLSGKDKHIESINNAGAKLMLDDAGFVKEMIGTTPLPSNHSNFAIQYDSVEELNKVVYKLVETGYTIFKQPWDAFWGQRYAIIKDPDGYMLDLYAYL